MKKTDCLQIECPFCNNLISGNSFLETSNFKAVYNIAPILEGHSLVIPARHKESLMELTDSELNEMMLFARKTTRLLQLAFGSEGFDWSIQDGASAGQTVMHLHLHIVPRKTGDLAKGKEWFQLMKNNEKQMLDSKNRERLTDREFAEITNMLKEKALASNI